MPSFYQSENLIVRSSSYDMDLHNKKLNEKIKKLNEKNKINNLTLWKNKLKNNINDKKNLSINNFPKLS